MAEDPFNAHFVLTVLMRSDMSRICLRMYWPDRRGEFVVASMAAWLSMKMTHFESGSVMPYGGQPDCSALKTPSEMTVTINDILSVSQQL